MLCAPDRPRAAGGTPWCRSTPARSDFNHAAVVDKVVLRPRARVIVSSRNPYPPFCSPRRALAVQQLENGALAAVELAAGPGALPHLGQLARAVASPAPRGARSQVRHTASGVPQHRGGDVEGGQDRLLGLPLGIGRAVEGQGAAAIVVPPHVRKVLAVTPGPTRSAR